MRWHSYPGQPITCKLPESRTTSVRIDSTNSATHVPGNKQLCIEARTPKHTSPVHQIFTANSATLHQTQKPLAHNATANMHIIRPLLALLGILALALSAQIGQMGVINRLPAYVDPPAPDPAASSSPTALSWYVLKPEWDPWRFCQPTATLVENSSCVPAVLDCKSIYQDYVISRDWFWLRNNPKNGFEEQEEIAATTWVEVIARGSCSVQVFLGDGVEQAS